MPTFDLTSPDGKTYSVEGPDGATPEQAFQILQQHLAAAPAAPSYGADIAKSLPADAAGLISGTLGLPGDVSNLLAKGSKVASDYLAQKMGFETDAKPLPEPILPTSGSIQNRIEGITGPLYQPQTGPGMMVQNAINFAPAVLGGPETLAAKLLTRVAAPAVASEAGRALTEGTAAQPYGELAGALAGAGGASAVLSKLKAAQAARAAAATIPEVGDLKAAARAQYQDPAVAAVQIKPTAVTGLGSQIENDLVTQGFRPKLQSGVFDVVKELKNAPGPVGMNDLDAVRKALGVIGREVDTVGKPTANAAAARSAVSKINDFIPNLNPSDLLKGDAGAANSILREAQSNWGAAKRAEQVQTLASNAEINAASANSGANIQNATKQAFKPLLRNNGAKAIGYNDAEMAALNKIVRGTWAGSAARAAGNLLGGGGGLGMLAGGAAGYEAGGIPGAIAAGVAGRVLKKIGNRSTLNAVQNLDNLIRSRAPEAVRIAAQNPHVAQALPPRSIQALRALILTDPLLRSQNQNSSAIGSPNSYQASQ